MALQRYHKSDALRDTAVAPGLALAAPEWTTFIRLLHIKIRSDFMSSEIVSLLLFVLQSEYATANAAANNSFMQTYYTNC